MDVSSTIAETLYKKIESMNSINKPGFKLFSVLSKTFPERGDELTIAMKIGLASDNTEVAEEAVLGLKYWLSSNSKPLPDEDLLREIAIMIATRRKGVLNRALQVARWIFTTGLPEQRETIAPLTLHGLSYLFEELRYDREHVDGEDIPLLRWGCAHLAVEMESAGYNEEPTVKNWVEVVKSDPLPEVRRAKEPNDNDDRSEQIEG